MLNELVLPKKSVIHVFKFYNKKMSNGVKLVNKFEIKFL